MAISQDKYVKIISTNVGTPEVTDRDLSGMVFTQGKGWVFVDTAKGETTVQPFEGYVQVYSSDDALKYFGTESAEYDFAKRYFGFMTADGHTPLTLTFARVKVTDGEGNVLVYKSGKWYKVGTGTEEDTEVETPTIETPEEALIRMNDSYNNFGSFCFLDEGYTCAQIKAVSKKVEEYNYRYLFSVATSAEYRKSQGEAVTPVAVDSDNDSVPVENTTIESLMAYLPFNGTVIEKGTDLGSAFKPMAMFASVDYDGVDTTLNFMFKQFDDEAATVTSDDEKEALDKIFANYIGMVQVNGVMRRFYQCGVNADGEDTGVYCNEVWLKSRIASEILDTMLTVNKIPADEDGELIVYNIIASAAERGITNGTIERNKVLNDRQKRRVFQLTKNAEAWRAVENSGYYISIEIRQEDDGKYSLYYKLVYSKGDAIIYVEGHHYLV